jgi:hypothetical protein
MGSLIQAPANQDLQFSAKDSFAFPITFYYQPATVAGVTPSPQLVNVMGYTITAQAYQAGYATALQVNMPTSGVSTITVVIPKGTLDPSRNWTWDLTVDDGAGNVRVFMAGVIQILDTSSAQASGFVRLNTFSNPVQV